MGVLQDAVPLVMRNIDPGLPRDLLEEHLIRLPNENQATSVIEGAGKQNFDQSLFWSQESVRFLVKSMAAVASTRLDPIGGARHDDQVLWPLVLMLKRRLDRLKAYEYDLGRADLARWQDGFYPLHVFFTIKFSR